MTGEWARSPPHRGGTAAPGSAQRWHARETNMLRGFYFVKGDGNVQYSPTYSRGGLSAKFLMETLQKVGSTPPQLAITIEHKDIVDTVFVLLGTFPTITTVDVFDLDLSGIKEQWRIGYQITVAANQWEGYLINPLAPVWFPY
jgi:hypothetical protein